MPIWFPLMNIHENRDSPSAQNLLPIYIGRRLVPVMKKEKSLKPFQN